MKACCLAEAKRNVTRHRAVATCDGCGALVIGYGNESDWRKAQDELSRAGAAFEADPFGAKLWLIAKARSPR